MPNNTSTYDVPISHPKFFKAASVNLGVYVKVVCVTSNVCFIIRLWYMCCITESNNIYIYIYIEGERERERYIYIYIWSGDPVCIEGGVGC